MGSHLSLTLALPQHMDTQKYNGWTNYATWLCNLWFPDFRPLFEDHIEDFSDEHEDKADLLNTLEMWIKDDVLEYVDSTVDGVGFARDLLDQALNDIDFRDLAEHYVDDVWDAIETHRLNQKEALTVA